MQCEIFLRDSSFKIAPPDDAKLSTGNNPLTLQLVIQEDDHMNLTQASLRHQ
jgi:hypothetical protein